MADSPITSFSSAAYAAGATDYFYLVQGGADWKLSAQTFLANLRDPLVGNSNSGSTASLNWKGATDANLVYVNVATDMVGIGVATPAEKLDVNGNVAVRGVLKFSGTPEALNCTGASHTANITSAVTRLQTNTTLTTVTVPDGSEGQVKVVVLANKGTHNANVVPTNKLGYTNVLLDANGDSVTLLFSSGAWVIIGNNGATIS